jgi:SAM-dependent methyltransferase
MTPEQRDGADYELSTRRHYQDTAVAAAYHAQFASGFSPRTLSHLLVARAEQAAVRRLLDPIRQRLALVADIPCGTGKLVPVLAPIPTIGGDVSRQMMTIARAGARDTSAPWQFAQLDVTALPFQSKTFDLVICLRLLHRVPQDIKVTALGELTRVSRRFVMVSYGVTNAWHALRQRLRRLVRGGNSVPYPMSRESAADLFRKSGWRVASRVSPLPVVSAEEIALLVRDE